MKLYFSRNYNPRLAVATARYLKAPVEYEFAAPFQPDQQDKFRKLNPNISIPILVEDDGTSLWEADAIACRLSGLTGCDFWRVGDEQPQMTKWLSWGMWNFIRACDMVHFERVTKQRYGLGPIVDIAVSAGLSEFNSSSEILGAHLTNRDWLLADGPSYADFRMACVLPYADAAGLPIDNYPAVRAWNDRLMQIDVWRDPFAGLDAPELPPLPG